jgi:hypothetical protein
MFIKNNQVCRHIGHNPHNETYTLEMGEVSHESNNFMWTHVQMGKFVRALAEETPIKGLNVGREVYTSTSLAHVDYVTEDDTTHLVLCRYFTARENGSYYRFGKNVVVKTVLSLKDSYVVLDISASLGGKVFAEKEIVGMKLRSYENVLASHDAYEALDRSQPHEVLKAQMAEIVQRWP